MQSPFGHPLIPDLTADPSLVEFDGTFYLYATTDGAGDGLATSGLPVVWKSRDFLNWSFVGSLFPESFDAKYWAPSGVIRYNGRYYGFPTLDERITATVSDSPEGPFYALDGKHINRTLGWEAFPIEVGFRIDAEVFRDDDGSLYMVWARRGIGQLKADLSGFENEPTLVPTKREGYSEGPYLFKRKGVYYYLYTLGGDESYQYAYMMSRTSPLGPWEAPEQDIIAQTNHDKEIYGPGHGCFFNPKGSDQWYFVYLEYGRSSTNRQVWVDKLNFNPDGTIIPIELTTEGVGALQPDEYEGRLNLARQASAVASSTRGEFRVPPKKDPRLDRVERFEPSLPLDGSNGTRWMATESDQQAWYQLDLGQVQPIQRTELYFVQPTQGHAYRLEHSTDGHNWQPYGGHDDVRVQSPHVDTQTLSTRYLKLHFLQGTAGLWDFRVYGGARTSPLP